MGLSKMDLQKPVLAMYDVRGIQNYIYRTAKVQDAIGASIIVENIILDALKAAIKKYKEKKLRDNEDLLVELEWFNKTGPLQYTEEIKGKDGKNKKYDVQVLYVGGGNALTVYSSRELCIEINKLMSKYVLTETYSLQLAIAVIEKTGRYDQDYERIYKEMASVKERMPQSLPLGTLPVTDIEIKTGLPKSANIPRGLEEYPSASRETYVKKLYEKKDEYRYNTAKVFDSYIEKKGEDSIIAVIHADGNNMGLRIRSLISGITEYESAVCQMRKISFHINQSYKSAFDSMEKLINGEGKNKETNVLKILVAGDDITYICKGKYALASVEYLAREVAKKTMDGGTDVDTYGFSICAGISFIHSHFPFSIGYEVAESCCESAKNQAKKAENKKRVERGENVIDKIGNWVDFQFCKNVQAADLEGTRAREYRSSTGENLLIRPYELPLLDLTSRKDSHNRIEELKNNLEWFQNTDSDHDQTIPRSHIKRLRNLYSEGKPAVNEFAAFLKSRDWKMPDGKMEMYIENGTKAKWYDAIELMDDYVSLEMIEKVRAQQKSEGD